MTSSHSMALNCSTANNTFCSLKKSPSPTNASMLSMSIDGILKGTMSAKFKPGITQKCSICSSDCESSDCYDMFVYRPDSPTTRNQSQIPFFPFLMYCSNEVHGDGTTQSASNVMRRKVCKICNLLLLSQWNKFEFNRVPFQDRFYWIGQRTDTSFPTTEIQLKAASQEMAHYLRQPNSRSYKHPSRSITPDYCLAIKKRWRNRAVSESIMYDEPSTLNLSPSEPETNQTEANSFVIDLSVKNNRDDVTDQQYSYQVLDLSYNSTLFNTSIGHDSRLGGNPSQSSSISCKEPKNSQNICSSLPPVDASNSPTIAVETYSLVSPTVVTSTNAYNSYSASLTSSRWNMPPPAIPLASKYIRSSEVTNISLKRPKNEKTNSFDRASTIAEKNPTFLDNLCSSLAMPDKRLSIMSCYICATEYNLRSLVYIFTKEPPVRLAHCSAPGSIGQQFYPSLLLHPRPPRSIPFDAAGRILVCVKCRQHLDLQWRRFEMESVAHVDRNYELRNRDRLKFSKISRSTTFVCYICALDYDSSFLNLLYVRPNKDGETFYRYIEDLVKPPGASPISPQGMVQACAVCFKAIRNNDPGYKLPLVADNESSLSTDQYQTPPKKRKLLPLTEVLSFKGTLHTAPAEDLARKLAESHDMVLLNAKQDYSSPTNVTCPLCYRIYSSGSLKTLATRRSITEFVDNLQPYFPFLPKDNAYACPTCFTELLSQWNSSQNKRIPVERRIYRLFSLIGPLVIHSSSEELWSHLEAPTWDDNVSLPDPKNDIDIISNSSSVLPSSSSFYCFLCGLHSELSFSRFLYAKPRGKRSPVFPFMLNHVVKPQAEKLDIEDGSALVCTFCYHSLILQWKNRQRKSKEGNTTAVDEAYNYNDYVCYVCSKSIGRKKVRALRVEDYTFLHHFKKKSNLAEREDVFLENGDMFVVCLSCFNSLKSQSQEADKFGIPIAKRQFHLAN